MDPNQLAGAGAPADDAFMAELLADTGGEGQQPDSQQHSEPAPQDRSAPQAREHERIPLRDLLDERDRRQAAERRIAEFEAAEKKRQEDANKGQPGNFWEGPDVYLQGYEKRLMSTVEQRFHDAQMERVRERFEDDEERVKDRDPDGFKLMDAWLLEHMKQNPGIGQEAARQRRPVQWLMDRWRETATLQEVGSDPNAYRQKLLDEALKDPEFLARAQEAARGGGFSGQPRSDTGQFAPKTQAQPQRATLPSMRAAGSAGVVATRPSADQSGDDLLDEVFAS